MRYGRHGWSYLCLRLGLGAVFLWIGVDIWRHPEAWLGYVPSDPALGMPRETVLSTVSVFDAALGILLVMNVWPKLVGLAAAAHLAGVVASNGIDAVLIRDVGLLGAALAIVLWPAYYRRRGRWLSRLPWPLRRRGAEYGE